jgi:hypothetical protein
VGQVSNRTTSVLEDGSKIVLTLIDNLKLDWVCFDFFCLLDYDYIKYQDKRMSKEHHKETALD